MEAILAPTGSLYRSEMLRHLRAAIAMAGGEPAQAVAELEAALAAAPYEPAFYRHALARAHERAGDLAAARVAYEQALAIHPRHPPSLFGLAALLEGAGDPAACERYRQFLEVWRDADSGLPALAVAEQGAGRTCAANDSVSIETTGSSTPRGGVR
jgi:tetratricopeptide (TPR) repeat protein